MICDADTWIGHWPFRALPRTSAADLLRQMDKQGIDKALVGSLHGLLYKDAHEANHELVREIRRHRDRLIPCAMVNPTYYGWERDLTQCREEFGMPVVRLTSDYHGYKLTDACARDLVAAAHARKMRVALYGRIVDSRGRHRLDPGREANHGEVSALVKKFSRAEFLMLNFDAMVRNRRLDKPACYYDVVRFLGDNGLRLEREIKTHGADRFVFGTTMLMRYGKCALLALDACRITRREREAIEWKNLARLVPEIRSR